MKTIKHITFFFSLLIFGSCSNNSGCTKIKLSSDDKEWFDFYKKYDSLSFKSDYDNIDTLTVASSINPSYTVCNKFELSNYQYEELGVQLEPSDCYGLRSSYCDIKMNFTKHLQLDIETECLKNFYVFDMRSDLIDNLTSFKDTIQIKGLNKSLICYTFNYTLPRVFDLKGGPHTLKEFSWSKEFGLLRYKLSNDETYELSRWW